MAEQDELHCHAMNDDDASDVDSRCCYGAQWDNATNDRTRVNNMC